MKCPLRRRLVPESRNCPQYRILPNVMGTSPSPKISPPRSKSRISGNSQVGPGSYYPRLLDKVQTYKIVKSDKPIRDPTESPGPFDYTPEKSFNYLYSGLSKSISGILRIQKQHKSKNYPGPGSYNAKSMDRIKGPKLMPKVEINKKIPEIKKKIKLDTTTPSRVRGKLETFGKAQRDGLVSKSITPGPDSYHIDTSCYWKRGLLNGSNCCTFGVKSSDLFKVANIPGPGAYGKDTCNEEIGYTIGKALRQPPETAMYTDMYYDQPNIYPSPRISFGVEKKTDKLKLSKYPGPGSYNIPDTVGKIPKYLINPINTKK